MKNTGAARYFGMFLIFPIFKYYQSLPEDLEKKEREKKLMDEADEYVKTEIKTDPVLGNPEISAENLAALISSNYGFMSMIDLISLNKKSNEFWEYMCYKVDTENDGEKWGDYID
eukprot:CAMPEP_0168314822 /NCGR_PEP_ID=MMETSP0210-20121227/9542_1 /TAXON_ID=40633 /ORGANISM="Condylostoma magnum, Strain COL2" /LENGTH=114 /DNA_ID=CAMNT_0008285197 /DNA_START=145 /DNA_END=489 /DNA_ORIENTATION=+